MSISSLDLWLTSQTLMSLRLTQFMIGLGSQKLWLIKICNLGCFSNKIQLNNQIQHQMELRATIFLGN